MKIHVGDWVVPSAALYRRSWGYNYHHLEGVEMRVTKVESCGLITFLCKDGKGVGENRAYRRWHESNLSVVNFSLENV